MVISLVTIGGSAVLLLMAGIARWIFRRLDLIEQRQYDMNGKLENIEGMVSKLIQRGRR